MREARYRRDGREVAVERARYGTVVLAEREPLPVIESCSWDADGGLLLRGSYLGAPGTPLEVVLRCPDASTEHVLRCTREADGFGVRIAPGAMPTFGQPLPLADGPWDLAVRGADGRAAPMACDHARLAGISHRKVAVGPKLYAFTTAGYDAPVITAEPQLRLSEQGNFNRRVLRRAFYPYPRDDVLCGGAERAAAIRARLGIPDGKRVVLYAPTWRDNQFYASGRYRFDLRLDLERAARALGPGHVLLIRGHHHLANDVHAGAQPGFALNVTAYPDIGDLFTIADVLITDYSSVMFDFAVTGRPMLFFTYDLASYRDTLRGFYFDFEAEAPGPLLATSDEVIAALTDVDGAAAGYRDAYAAFAAKYCPLDDGKAGARVCDRLFGG